MQIKESVNYIETTQVVTTLHYRLFTWNETQFKSILGIGLLTKSKQFNQECKVRCWFTLRYLCPEPWYCKFYPKKVIQIDRLELSTEVSHVKKLFRTVIQKKDTLTALSHHTLC